MFELSVLLENYISKRDAIYTDQPWEKFNESEKEPQEKNWQAWLFAFKAYRNNKFNEAERWLNTAKILLKDYPDKYCIAEVSDLYSLIFESVGEYETAINYARTSWDIWYSLAVKPDMEAIAESVRPLFKLLYSPEPIPENIEKQISFIWLADRFSLQFLNSAQSLIALSGNMNNMLLAEKTIKEVKIWYDTHLKNTGFKESYIALPYARLLDFAGNFYNQIGKNDEAFLKFDEALHLLDPTINHIEFLDLRARLNFNAGNALSKLKRYNEANEYYLNSLSYFKGTNDEDAKLRIYHAQLLVKWQMKYTNIVPELEEQILLYEKLYKSIDNSKRNIVKQNLSFALQLWLTIKSECKIISGPDVLEIITYIMAIRSPYVESITHLKTATLKEIKYSSIDKRKILVEKFSRQKSSLLLILESGIESLLIFTMRSGNEPIETRVSLAHLSQEAINSFVALLEIQKDEISDIGSRIKGIESKAAEDLMIEAEKVWNQLPENIQKDIKWAKTIYYSPSNFGSIDELPFELIKDENTFLGLKKAIVRISSFDLLLQALAKNRVNRLQSKKALVVHSEDVAGYNTLTYAAEEVLNICEILKQEDYEVIIIHKPKVEELLRELNNDIDIFHYIGHSEADENGEFLVINDTEFLRAIQLNTIEENPAPVTNLASCYAGRSREIIGGNQQGFAVSLIGSGAPIVIASTYELPDHLGLLFSNLFYKCIFKLPAGKALLELRKVLDEKGINPVCWSSYIQFGKSDRVLENIQNEPLADLNWTDLIIRYCCTFSNIYFKQAFKRIEENKNLSTFQIQLLEETLKSFKSKDKIYFTLNNIYAHRSLFANVIEEQMAFDIINILGFILYSETTGDEAHNIKIGLLETLLTIQDLLSDSYLLVAIADAIPKVQALPFDNDTERNIFKNAQKALYWISADKLLLEEKTQSFNHWKTILKNSTIVNIQQMLGVDSETFQKADSGDRKALKKVVCNMLKRQASATSITSNKSWTYWMQRIIGCSASDQSIADFLGAIDKEKLKNNISEQEYEVLVKLIEQYIGPDYIDNQTIENAYLVFDKKNIEFDVIKAFDYFDLISTDHTKISQKELEGIIAYVSANLDVESLVYFQSVWCQKEAEKGAFNSAITEILKLLKNMESLSSQDKEFVPRLGLIAIMLGQIYEYNTDKKSAEEVKIKYRHAIEIYNNKQLEKSF